MSTRIRLQYSLPRLVPLAAAVALCLVASAQAATITLTTGNTIEASGKCTLQDAIASINQGSSVSANCAFTGSFGSNDTIMLQNYSYTLGDNTAIEGSPMDPASALVLTQPMTLIGNLDSNTGQPLATIQRDTSTSDFRVIETSADLTLIGVKIQNGISDATTNAGGTGGGILAVNKSTPITLTLINSVVTGNTAVGTGTPSYLTSYGGGIYTNHANVVLKNSSIGTVGYYTHGNSAYQGGGMDVVGGNVTMYSSTVSGNKASNGYGGGINTTGKATITNSTFSGNYASTGGGGVDAKNVYLKFSTFSGNTTVSGQPGSGVLVNVDPNSAPTFTLIAALMYGNDPGNDVDANGAVTMSTNYSLVGTSGANVTISGSHNLQCNPNLSGLGNNGGPTRTIALTTGSCAVDAGPATATGLASDQRGVLFERRAGTATDIGAFELQPANDRIFYNGFEP